MSIFLAFYLLTTTEKLLFSRVVRRNLNKILQVVVSLFKFAGSGFHITVLHLVSYFTKLKQRSTQQWDSLIGFFMEQVLRIE